MPDVEAAKLECWKEPGGVIPLVVGCAEMLARSTRQGHYFDRRLLFKPTRQSGAEEHSNRTATGASVKQAFGGAGSRTDRQWLAPPMLLLLLVSLAVDR